MKKINLKKMIATAVMLSVAFVNPANTYSNVKADTLKVHAFESEVMPEVETVEEGLEVEDWMMNTYTYDETTLRVENWMFAAETTATESTLAVENWMLETEVNAEATLAVENWMATTNVIESECDLAVENWMLKADESIEEPLALEAWMF